MLKVSYQRSRHLEFLHKLVGVASTALTIAAAIVITTLSGASADPDRQAQAAMQPALPEYNMPQLRSDVMPLDQSYEVAQATFVRQDVVYSDGIVAAETIRVGRECGVRCGHTVRGTLGHHPVKERYWSRATVAPARGTVSPTCRTQTCVVR
ncbi:hypothetical protein [Acuticoccus yangtzensis]|uniref:hypothetical protein n=1 Tax=Acuticoccus yangtzensis TaxID=1443441 RepID=UPI0011152C80|nr:hypothetical protein [Acuticoccus yangtzensis]